jgi:mannose-6-phosphate isomerase-like protein (cupin superfamily)
LITHRDRTQEVRKVVQQLKAAAHESYATHRTVIRPWGSYTVLEEGPCFKIKRITVKAGAALSLQKHTRRSEHWVVVEGTAKIVIGDKTCLLQTNESTFVPMHTPHRLSNPSDKPLVIIEVQTGEYLGEDDIIRFEDTYGRV